MFFVLLLGVVPAAAQTPPGMATLHVVTGYASPFVKLPGTPVSGYSIEVWQEVARRLNVVTQWTVLPDLSDEAQLAAVAGGRADVAISALAITAEREALVDFSLPYFESGLQILVGTEEGDLMSGMLRTLGSSAMLVLMAIGAGLMLALGHVLWLVERGHNPAFQRGYFRSIYEGVWGTWLIIATGEHGDRYTPRAMKRLTIGALWLFGVLFTAQLTAMVTSELTVQQLRSNIRGPGDLPGRSIATAPGSVAAAWLTAQGLHFAPLTDTETAYAMLTRGELDAVVYNAPQLRYWLANRGPSHATLVGQVFRPQGLGIAVATHSPLRERINMALLTMQEDGTADEIRRRWFGAER